MEIKSKNCCKIKDLDHLNTFFYILWASLNHDKTSYNELLIEQILWAIEQEFSHYDLNLLLKHFDQYIMYKKGMSAKTRLKMKSFIVSCNSIKTINTNNNDYYKIISS